MSPVARAAALPHNARRVSVTTPVEFVAKWSRVALSERAASQEFFLDLCRLLAQPTPAEHDATGAEYAFEKGVAVSGDASSRGGAGQRGFADVWWKGKFAWEFKRADKHKDLNEAYAQLQKYREALDNPPLLIVCDIRRIEIHTNFTGAAKRVHRLKLEDLAEPRGLDLLRRAFAEPWSFKPDQTPEQVTKVVAEKFATLAQRLRSRGEDPHDAAHFLMKCMFCLFAEDVGLLPGDRFKTLAEAGFDALRKGSGDEAQVRAWFNELFQAMRCGGHFWGTPIQHFNGGLFDEAPALTLTADDLAVLTLAAAQDWSSVEPAIFGTLFERSLDPAKRSQIGAHYTSREDILLIVEPIVMAPLRREWEEVRRRIDEQLERRRRAATKATRGKADRAIEDLLDGFLRRLASVRILDPACGSGNFLYVAIQQLLGLEKEVITFAARPEIAQGLLPHVRPTQLHGVEINPYAAELAQVVIWIGYLQWMRDNGFQPPRDPILSPLTTIEHKDAILDRSDPDTPRAPDWPEAECIIGNPPFLGSKLFRKHGLSDEYLRALYACYDLPNTSDLCCYWFERARQEIAKHEATRAGLIATQGIRGGANRETLKRIKKTGDIFMAWSDRLWVLDGAAVQVSMVGFGGKESGDQTLDGREVPAINSDLTADVDTASAVRLPENLHLAFMAGIKVGPFDIDWSTAFNLLIQPTVTDRSAADVVRPWLNGLDVTRRERGMWIIDFGIRDNEAEAAQYQAAFEHVREHVYPERRFNRMERRARLWWLHGDVGARIRDTVLANPRYIATARVTKHRLFKRVPSAYLPDAQLIVFARSDEYFFGALHSSVHEVWARRMGTQLREAESGFRYTPTTCFETFPLPWTPGEEPREGEEGRDLLEAIACAARELDEQRQRWLNPPEWIEQVARAVDLREDFSGVPEEARPLLRRSAIMAAAAKDPRLKKRTLTNLYNERPTWLRLAHRRLDEAVLSAYAGADPDAGWNPAWAAAYEPFGAGIITDEKKDSQETRAEKAKARETRAETDEKILAALLRLNALRASQAK